MKKLELYQCEVCGTQYKSKLECTECETRHMKELRIVKSRYLPFTQDSFVDLAGYAACGGEIAGGTK